MNIIILGDKFQKRMKSKGCVGLIKINNKNIIQYQYKILKQIFPSANIIYVYGFESKRFNTFIEKNSEINSNIKVIYNQNYEQFNSAYSLSLASDFLNDSCIIIFGDTIISKKTFQKFIPNENSQIFLSTKYKNKLGCIISDSRVTNISYDLDNYLSDIYYLSRNDSQTIQELLNHKINYNCFIFEIINKLIDMNHKIVPFFSEHQSQVLITNKV